MMSIEILDTIVVPSICLVVTTDWNYQVVFVVESPWVLATILCKSKPTDLGLGAELLMTGLPWVIVVLAIQAKTKITTH